ncbi:TRAP-type C4-dicarboxylate transport system, substrate-binding protein [Marinobacter segnicrescens]|uniref:TRAP-type C4-dicarboxylate transport system, substrate-binding protein n=2 Tax=Marinobacter segnicrescens TaxID=430453 RepID=A0A1I0A8B9_9GAMM|nr:TRAP-type C4-dicarboxylate transport system, substrate-binding protein [Marinobacter segnicrescens]
MGSQIVLKDDGSFRSSFYIAPHNPIHKNFTGGAPQRSRPGSEISTMKTLIKTGLTSVAAAGILVAGTATAETISHATGYPPNSIGADAANSFAEALKEISGGDMTAKVYAGSLLSFSETSPGIRDGMADSGFVLLSYYPSEFPAANLAGELSMLVDLEDVPPSHSGLAYVGALAEFVFNHCDTCVDEFAGQNQVFTGASASSDYMLLCNKEVSTLDQLQGKRIRSAGPQWARWAESLGATPVTLSVSDSYEALNQGVLDCSISSSVDLDIFKLKEVVTDITPEVPGGVYGGTAVNNVNRDVWAGLSEQQRRDVLKATAVLGAVISWDYQVGAAKELEAAEGNGITVHEASEELQQASSEFVRSDIGKIAANYEERHGIENAEELAATFRELLGKWVELTRDIDNVDDLADLYWDELYSKVDVSSYAL